MKLEKCNMIAKFCKATVADIRDMGEKCECIRCLGKKCAECSIAKKSTDERDMQEWLYARCRMCKLFKNR